MGLLNNTNITNTNNGSFEQYKGCSIQSKKKTTFATWKNVTFQCLECGGMKKFHARQKLDNLENTPKEPHSRQTQ